MRAGEVADPLFTQGAHEPDEAAPEAAAHGECVLLLDQQTPQSIQGLLQGGLHASIAACMMGHS